MVTVPVAAVPEAVMVSALLVLPFAGGVAGLGAYAHDTPAGNDAQARLTALANPF